MHKFAEAFAKFCKDRLDLNRTESYIFKSLPLCIIDSVYSLRAKYKTVTLPIDKRYAEAFLNGDLESENDTITKFLENIKPSEGKKNFGHEILKSHNKLGGKAAIPKEDIVRKIAEYLHALKIETIEDFRNFENKELLEVVLYGVRGFKTAGVNYLYMLTGDTGRCKPDVHIHNAIQLACGSKVSDKDCQEILTDAVSILNEKYHLSLTVRSLDGIVWEAFSSKQISLEK